MPQVEGGAARGEVDFTSCSPGVFGQPSHPLLHLSPTHSRGMEGAVGMCIRTGILACLVNKYLDEYA